MRLSFSPTEARNVDRLVSCHCITLASLTHGPRYQGMLLYSLSIRADMRRILTLNMPPTTGWARVRSRVWSLEQDFYSVASFPYFIIFHQFLALKVCPWLFNAIFAKKERKEGKSNCVWGVYPQCGLVRVLPLPYRSCRQVLAITTSRRDQSPLKQQHTQYTLSSPPPLTLSPSHPLSLSLTLPTACLPLAGILLSRARPSLDSDWQMTHSKPDPIVTFLDWESWYLTFMKYVLGLEGGLEPGGWCRCREEWLQTDGRVVLRYSRTTQSVRDTPHSQHSTSTNPTLTPSPSTTLLLTILSSLD